MNNGKWTCPGCGRVQDSKNFCEQCGKINDNIVVNPMLNDPKYTEIHEINDLGRKTIRKVDVNDNTVSLTTFSDDSITEVLYDENGNISAIEDIYSNDYFVITFYKENGKKDYVYESYNDRLVQVNYDGNEKVISTLTEHKDGRKVEEIYNDSGIVKSRIESYKDGTKLEQTFNSDGKVVSLTKKDADGTVAEETLTSYDNGEKKEAIFKDGKLINEKYYYSEDYDDLRYTVDYQYNNDKVSTKTVHQKITRDNSGANVIFGDLTNVHTYDYDDNGKATVRNEFFIDGKKIIEFNSDDVIVDYYDGIYSFTNNNNNIYCEVDEQGNINYINCDKDETLSLDTNGNFSISNSDIVGNYRYDSDGNIVCTDQNGNIYKYDNTGQLIKEKVDNKEIEYDYNSYMETTTIDGDSKYRRINHIEYDEDDYHHLMTSLVSIGQSAMSSIDSACSSVDAALNSMSPEKYGGDTSGIRSAAAAQIDAINNLNTTINYSLLAYDTCDKDLKSAVDTYIIDNLFDPNETNIEKYFKDNINSHIEDRDSDGIFEYKKDTDFNDLYEKAIPTLSYTDDNGNMWYFNKNNCLITADGDNLTLLYDKMFGLSFTDNGAVKLTDSNGNPLNIFGDYNQKSRQFGGCQSNLDNVSLLNDSNIMNVLNSYFPFSTYEEKEQLLAKAAEKGCGYTAVTNAIFKEFEGQEDRFLDTFGFPMYNVKINDNNEITVDFNYEPVILELFAELNGKDEVIGYELAKGKGSSSDTYQQMRTFVNNKYGITLGSDESSTPLFDSYGIFGDDYYKIYDLDGQFLLDTSSLENGGRHAMTKLGETDDGKWIVSTWGMKLLCEVSDPSLR